AIKVEDKIQKFKVNGSNYELHIPGRFNILNALAAITLAKELNIDDEVIVKAISKFQGTWRRFEVLGEYKGSVVVSDYAHHPTAVAGLIKAAKDFYPKHRVFIAFQPHQHSRTKKLFQQFTKSFDEADFIVIQEIWDVLGREEKNDQDISSKDLVKEVEKNGKYVFYSKDAQQTKRIIDEHLEKNNVLLIAGAGDIYLLAESLCSKK
ncbi:MAG: cyanophycin synthetase, partial [Chrysiogenia bacterium]